MARGRSRARFVRPPPRTKMWIGQGVGSTALPASSKILVATLSAAALLLRPFTILRTHIDILYLSDQTAVTELPFGAYGQLIVTDTAAAIGVTAIPDPSGTDGDPEADWFIHQQMAVQVNFQSAVGFDGNFGMHYTIDSKAMRKVGPDDNEVAMFSEVAAVGANIITGGRQLVQLH